jgi:DNA modification methylase
MAYFSRSESRPFDAIENDDMTDEQFEVWLRSAFAILASSMRPNACIYVCHIDSASPPKITFERVFAEFFKKSSTIIWVKQSAGMGHQDFRSQHEPILYGWKEGGRGRHFCNGDRTRTTVWQISRDPTMAYIHPTQKPVALIEEAVVSSSKNGWNIGDFFAGSGSGLIACQRTARKFFGVELNPAFCESAIERWEVFCESDAVLEGDGRTFKEIREDRRRRGLGTRQSRRASGGRRSTSATVPSVS